MNITINYEDDCLHITTMKINVMINSNNELTVDLFVSYLMHLTYGLTYSNITCWLHASY